jgi:hypothetical protein
LCGQNGENEDGKINITFKLMRRSLFSAAVDRDLLLLLSSLVQCSSTGIDKKIGMEKAEERRRPNNNRIPQAAEWN